MFSAILFVLYIYSRPSFIKSLAFGLRDFTGATRVANSCARRLFSSAARNDGVVAYDAASYVANCNLVTRCCEPEELMSRCRSSENYCCPFCRV